MEIFFMIVLVVLVAAALGLCGLGAPVWVHKVDGGKGLNVSFEFEGQRFVEVVHEKLALFYTGRGGSVVQVDENGDLVRAVFMMGDRGMVEIVAKDGDMMMLFEGKMDGLANRSLMEAGSSLPRFFPGCFEDDVRPHVLEIGVLMDDGIDPLEVEFAVLMASEIFKAQLNLELRVIHERRIQSCPRSGVAALDLMKTLEKDKAGVWHWFTTCALDTAGLAYIGTVCGDDGVNVGVSSTSSKLWRTFVHEIAHNFGATHTLGRGGIMDYGDGSIPGLRDDDGTPLFGLLLEDQSRDEICLTLERAKVSRCAFFQVKEPSSRRCGDRYVDDGEACECANGSISCGACRNCRITEPTVECSVDTFLSYSSSENGGHFSAPECCQNGILQGAEQVCNGGEGTCGAFGRCTDKCGLYGLSVCGTTENGCRQKCAYGSTCSAFFVDERGAFIGNMDDGTKCFDQEEEEEGVCAKGVCIKKQRKSDSLYSFRGKKGETIKQVGPALVRFGDVVKEIENTTVFTCGGSFFGIDDAADENCEALLLRKEYLCPENTHDCEMPRPGTMQFGTDDRWVETTFTWPSLFACDYNVLGDPYPRHRKHCYLAPPRFQFLCNENDQQCQHSDPFKDFTIRFGAQGKWVYRTIPKGQTFSCTNRFFGKDPYYGRRKQCQVLKL